MKTYIKVEIKTEADLPKEKTIRICHFKSSDKITDLNYFNDEDDNNYWLRNVDWYFQPVELSFPTEDEIKKMQSGMMCGDSVNCEWVDGYIDGFKKAIIEIKKRNGL